MKSNSTNTNQNKVRFLPAFIIVAVMLFLRYLLPLFNPSLSMPGIFASMLGGIGIRVWWLFFSRASKGDRWLGFLFWIIAQTVAELLAHESIATANMGLMLTIGSYTLVSACFVFGIYISRNFATLKRRLIIKF